jgi:FKBP-type peptidyl-prolyl cis-trans isomerase FkpA
MSSSLRSIPAIIVRLYSKALALVALILWTSSAGCTESVTSPSGTAPFSQTDLRAGTGATAIVGSTVTVHYTGWLYGESRPDQKGMQFDSSAGGTPFTFGLGVGQVISGWDQGVPGMRVGGLRRLVIPPSLAYGAIRTGPIPPNATLVFEIELLEVQ